ncbi:uncharacterized protein LOC110828620 [Zootermopsis nevadensis]|uniref:Osiris 19 n=1 Tax=Zootermopsis nevadensis TaxID=136037 RepID=A0A067RKX1_ZOONE|nr:uncharacterized protein LOC110828620 [Zootermopsis nevadensis]KDR24516.1 hypothetical protein L798_00135 [Zootermopsis nevadensis]
MVRLFRVWCVVILASLAVAQPNKSKVSFKYESAMEQMRSECAQGNSDSAAACFKYKLFSAIDELFRNDSLEVSDAVSFVGNSAPKEDARGVLDQFQSYVQTHDVMVSLPGDSQLTLSSRNINNGELNLSLKFDQEDSADNATEARRRKKSKLKKILVPIAIFLLLKALTLIPLFIGILGIKAWNALQLSFGSFVLSFALAIFQLCKKLAGDSAPPQPIVAHASGWESQRSLDTGFDAHNLVYNAYAQAA